jgi:hypothetical protein
LSHLLSFYSCYFEVAVVVAGAEAAVGLYSYRVAALAAVDLVVAVLAVVDLVAAVAALAAAALVAIGNQ